VGGTPALVSGGGVRSFAMIGAYRLKDPDGEVDMKAHLVSDGDAVYQLPMTYHGAPLPDGGAVEGHVAAVRGQPLDPAALDAGGLVMGSWPPGGAGTESVTGCLAIIRS
jgi:hypothetical protein